jgi:ABC-type Na+ efflux pump permease subunit
MNTVAVGGRAVGLVLVIGLLLLILGCVAVRPRTPQVLYGTTATLAVMIIVVLVLVMGGVLPWEWPSG